MEKAISTSFFVVLCFWPHLFQLKTVEGKKKERDWDL